MLLLAAPPVFLLAAPPVFLLAAPPVFRAPSGPLAVRAASFARRVGSKPDQAAAQPALSSQVARGACGVRCPARPRLRRRSPHWWLVVCGERPGCGPAGALHTGGSWCACALLDQVHFDLRLRAA